MGVKGVDAGNVSCVTVWVGTRAEPFWTKMKLKKKTIIFSGNYIFDYDFFFGKTTKNNRVNSSKFLIFISKEKSLTNFHVRNETTGDQSKMKNKIANTVKLHKVG